MCVAEVFLFHPDGNVKTDGSRVAQNRAVSQAAYAFVREEVARRTDTPPQALTMLRGTHGKPYIENCPISFNLSHSGGLVLVAFASVELGVDIEMVRSVHPSVIRRCCTEEEKSYLSLAADEEEAYGRLFEVWTAKEALLKLSGDGLSGGFDFCTAHADGMLQEVWFPPVGRVHLVCGRGEAASNSGDIFLGRASQYDEPICCDSVVDFRFAVCGAGIKEIFVKKL